MPDGVMVQGVTAGITQTQLTKRYKNYQMNNLDRDALRDQLKRHEGVKDKVYNDSLGIPTVGVGFNLTRKDARKQIEALGLDYDNVLSGSQRLSKGQMDSLLDITMDESIEAARGAVPQFDSLPENQKRVFVDMIFNMGQKKFNKFRNLKKSIGARDIEGMKREMQDSLWWNQVGNRGPNLIRILEGKN